MKDELLTDDETISGPKVSSIQKCWTCYNTYFELWRCQLGTLGFLGCWFPHFVTQGIWSASKCYRWPRIGTRSWHWKCGWTEQP
jgi:hypothetical protein